MFHESAQNAYVPSVVTSGRLLDANAKLQVSYSAGEAVGPGVGGLLVQLVTAPFAVVADAVSYVVSAGMLARIRTTESRTRRTVRTRPWTEVREGVRVLLRDRLLGPWAVWGAVSVVFMGAFEAQYLLFAVKDLALSPLLVGLVAVAGAAGAIPAAFLTARLARRVPPGRSIVLALMVYFALILAVSGGGRPHRGGLRHARRRQDRADVRVHRQQRSAMEPAPAHHAARISWDGSRPPTGS